MGQHACQHMVPPAGKLPHLVVIHPQIRFGLFKTLFDGPAHTRKPDEGFQTGGSAGIGDEIGISGVFPKSPANEQPNPPVGLSLFTQNDSTLRKFIGHRSLRSLRHRPTIPEVIVCPLAIFSKVTGFFSVSVRMRFVRFSRRTGRTSP